MQACLHLDFIIIWHNTYAEKTQCVFKIRKLLAPVWWGLVVWRCSLVATMSLLLSLLSSITYFYTFQITQKLAWRNYHFSILLAAEGKSCLLSVTHHLACAWDASPLQGPGGCGCLCRGQYLGCFAMVNTVCPSAWPWLPSEEPELSARVFRGFFVSRDKKVLWLHPLCTKIIIKNNRCTLRPGCLKWAVCLMWHHVCLLLLSAAYFLPILLLHLYKTITCRTKNFCFVKSN